MRPGQIEGASGSSAAQPESIDSRGQISKAPRLAYELPQGSSRSSGISVPCLPNGPRISCGDCSVSAQSYVP